MRWSTRFLVQFLCIYNNCTFVSAFFDATNILVNFVLKADRFLKNDNNISVDCKDHLAAYLGGLRTVELWAIKMFDSGGKFPSGILQGNTFELGAFDECLDIEKYLTPEKGIFGKYCLGLIPIDTKMLQLNLDTTLISSMHMQIMSENQFGIQIATCMPNACFAAEIQEFFEAVGYTIVFNDKLCQTKATQPQPNAGSFATLAFFCLIGLIMIASTVYDIIIYYSEKQSIHPLLTSFSILSNGKILITTSNNLERLSCLDGIRVFSLAWIIYGHSIIYRSFLPTNNSLEVWTITSRPENMYRLSGTMGVDTFFLITGLLISYNFMTTVVAKKMRFNIFIYYIHRYLRMTPLLAVIIVIYLTLVIHMGSGPLWPIVIDASGIEGCNSYWWKALLYVQNIGEQDSWCVSQSWYLCVDMQLFLLSPILLLPLKQWPKWTVAATLCLTLCSGIYVFVIAWIYKFTINVFDNENVSLNSPFNILYYMSMPGRAGPWLLGIVLGYIIFETKRRKTKLTLNKVLVVFLWAISLATIFVCVFIGHDLLFGEYDRLGNSLHAALVRLAWSIAVGWIIFACLFGFAGPANWFLSLPIFQIVSKLSFAMYLIHVVVIQYTTNQIRVPSTFSESGIMHGFWGDFAFTAAASVVLTLAIELPMVSIEKVIFSRRPATKQSDTETVESYAKPAELA